jgi:hypothetical protein
MTEPGVDAWPAVRRRLRSLCRLVLHGRLRAVPGQNGGGDEPSERSAPEGGFARLRRSLGLGLVRVSEPLRPGTQSGDPIRARARLESAAIKERHYYRQEISLNPSLRVRRDPSGHVKLVLPFDGEKYFTRQAYRDAMRACERGADRNRGALVGFLALTGHEKTDLSNVLGLEERHAWPILVQLPPAPDKHQVDPLLSDRNACVVSCDYRPTESFSADVLIEINDPDTSDIPLDLPSATEPVHIMRQIDFKPGLSLSMTVQLITPCSLTEGATARVSGAFIGWPTRTSLRSLELHVAGQAHSFRYNPDRAGGGGLEWRDVPMTAEPPPGGEVRVFRSPAMILSIPRPGELYRQELLRGEVEVTIDRLLSGTRARLFDSTGKQCQHPRLEIETVVATEFSVLLEDAFARRTLSPYQQMHFDEVIPDPMRLDDIITALRTRGFKVAGPQPVTALPGTDSEGWWLRAQRPHGPDQLSMLLCVVGTRYRTRRERQVPGGMKYDTSVDSGELRIYAYGQLPRDSRSVVREMNELRRALHERFDHLPARR